MSNKKSRRSARAGRQKSTTRLLIALAGVILILIAVFLGARRGAPADFVPEVIGSPSLKSDRDQVDLGDVPLGEWVEVDFDLTNVGDEPLRFTRQPYVEVVEGC